VSNRAHSTRKIPVVVVLAPDSVRDDLDVTSALFLLRDDLADAIRHGRDVRQQLTRGWINV